MQLDQDGYLIDLSSWDTSAAIALAQLDEVELDARHWEIIELLREFYAATEVSPAMRPLVKLVGERLGSDKGNSIYLMKLFGPSPAKSAAKWAGLPRPTNCI